MPKHRDLQSLTKLLEKTQSFEFNIKNVLPIMFTYDQFTPDTMLVLKRAFAWNTLNGCAQGSLREGGGGSSTELGWWSVWMQNHNFDHLSFVQDFSPVISSRWSLSNVA